MSSSSLDTQLTSRVPLVYVTVSHSECCSDEI